MAYDGSRVAPVTEKYYTSLPYMKIILLKDIPGVGVRGAIKDVSDGYAMNSLIPQKLAAPATDERVKAYEKEIRDKVASEKKKESDFDNQARLLENAKISVRVDANDKGHLYKQLSPDEIAERVRKELGVPVEKSTIVLKEQIKSLGRVDAEIKLGKKKVPLTVFVERKN